MTTLTATFLYESSCAPAPYEEATCPPLCQPFLHTPSREVMMPYQFRAIPSYGLGRYINMGLKCSLMLLVLVSMRPIHPSIDHIYRIVLLGVSIPSCDCLCDLPLPPGSSPHASDLTKDHCASFLHHHSGSSLQEREKKRCRLAVAEGELITIEAEVVNGAGGLLCKLARRRQEA